MAFKSNAVRSPRHGAPTVLASLAAKLALFYSASASASPPGTRAYDEALAAALQEGQWKGEARLGRKGEKGGG